MSDNWRKNICDVMIDNSQPWHLRHLDLIKQYYVKAPFYADYIGFLSGVYSKQWESLSELDIYLTKEIALMLGIKTKFIKASELNLEGAKTDRLISMCKQLGAKKYVSGPAALDYIEPDKFSVNNIELEYMDYTYPQYRQLYGPFEHGVSIIDMLFNLGDSAPKYIWG
jgi:hypothetical protein